LLSRLPNIDLIQIKYLILMFNLGNINVYFLMVRNPKFQLIALIIFLYFPSSNFAQLCSGSKVILLDTLVNDGSEWILEFNDEFSDSVLDYDKWEGKISSQGSVDGSDAYRTLDNVTVFPGIITAQSTYAEGVCQINLKKERVTKPMTFWDPASPIVTYEYTAADVVSKQQFKWGKYEIRCKIPKGKSFYSSFWMYGQQNNVGNEIDVFEFSNEFNALGQFKEDLLCKVVEMHYHLFDKTMSVGGIDYNCGNSFGNENTTDFSLDFHTFTMIWDRWAINWYIDGKLIKSAGQWYDINGHIVTRENIKPMQVVIRNDWYPTNPIAIIFALNLEANGKNAPESKTPFPSSLLVDYIRYYKKN
jgi:beta-glucanase (GH16 family)